MARSKPGIPAAASVPLHIVQIGFDDTIFRRDAPSDTLRRQQEYARELAEQRPGSALTVIMLTEKAGARPIEQVPLRILPLSAPRLRRWPALYRLLKRLHAKHPIDVIATQTVHADAWVALLFGARYGTAVVGQVHYDLFAPSARREALGPGPLGALRQAISLRLLRRMAAVRVVGKRVGTELRAAGARNVAVIPVPVTMTPGLVGAPSSAPESLAEARHPRVLYVGRLVPSKNLELWLRVAQQVARQVPESRFEIVGAGPLREMLEAKTGQLQLGDCVQFMGPVAYDALDPLYRRASVFLLTSHYEGFGRVLVEAALHGLPVVAPAIGGVEDIVIHGVTGFLHAPGDIEALSASVIRLLEDPVLRNEMGQRSRQSVSERYDPQRLTREWVSLLIVSARSSSQRTTSSHREDHET